MATIETALTRLLGIRHPILLAPMGSAAGGKLAAAVTHAGGLGLLGSGYADERAIRRELSEAGNARVGIGFILWALDKNPVALDVALDAKPAVVMLSFGDPSPYTGRIRAAGCRIICQVQTLDQAKQAAAAGADIIIAQGRDAGGHSGTTRGTSRSACVGSRNGRARTGRSTRSRPRCATPTSGTSGWRQKSIRR